jgi:molecular chaperone DnaJ
VRIEVDVPTRLSAEEEELLRSLASLRGEEVAAHDKGMFSRLKSAFQ